MKLLWLLRSEPLPKEEKNMVSDLANEIDAFKDSDLLFDARADVNKVERMMSAMERRLIAAFEAGYLAGKRSTAEDGQ
jgi:hypothetical protein